MMKLHPSLNCFLFHRKMWYEPFRSFPGILNCLKCGDPDTHFGLWKSLAFRLHYKTAHLIGHWLRDPVMLVWNWKRNRRFRHDPAEAAKIRETVEAYRAQRTYAPSVWKRRQKNPGEPTLGRGVARKDGESYSRVDGTTAVAVGEKLSAKDIKTPLKRAE